MINNDIYNPLFIIFLLFWFQSVTQYCYDGPWLNLIVYGHYNTIVDYFFDK